MNLQTGPFEVVYGTYWIAIVGESGTGHSVRVCGTEADLIPFTLRVNLGDAIREDLRRVFSEAHALKAALDAGVSREKWHMLRNKYGIPFPSHN